MLDEPRAVDTMPLMINGSRVVTPEALRIVNPADESTVGWSALASRAHVDAAVEAAVRAQKSWATVSDHDRTGAVLAIAGIIEKHRSELAHLVTKEQGKPLGGLGSDLEIQCCIDWTQAAAHLSLPDEPIQGDPAREVWLQRVPIGVVGSITPWNWPLMIAIWHLIPAVRLGCAVVIKPSPVTPLSTLRLVDLINGVLPPGVVNSVVGGPEIGGQLVDHPLVNKIVFTGSTQVGMNLMGRCTKSLKHVTLELGGNDAGIILPRTNIDQIVEQLVWSCLINSGQTCAALKRLYVHDSQYEQVVAKIVEFASRLSVGNGLEPSSQLGPLTTKAQVDHVDALIEDARARGARIDCGGVRPRGRGYFYPATVVAGATDDMRVVREEQFGPVIPVLRYRTIDEAVERANGLDCGLGGSVWGDDPVFAAGIAARLVCGTVWVNDHGSIHPAVPFGGVRSSGIGVQFGTEGLKEYTTVRIRNLPKVSG